jgi:hypothetical protein
MPPKFGLHGGLPSINEDGCEQPLPPPLPLTPHMSFVLWSLVLHGAPIVLGQLVLRVLHTSSILQKFSYVELFSGRRSVTTAMLNDGRVASPYDIVDDKSFENFLKPEGFAYAVLLILSLEGGGGLWAGIVCSSWVGLNLGTSGRKLWRPLGNQHFPSVHAGNVMAARLAMLLILCEALGVWWTVEQPCGSMLFLHPRLQYVLRRTRVFKHLLYQYNYGAIAKKGTWLFSNRPWICDMDKHKLPGALPPPRSLVTVSRKNDGSRSYTANKKTKASQFYPKHFGIAVAQVYRDHDCDLKNEFSDLYTRVVKFADGRDVHSLLNIMDTKFEVGKEGWADADIASVFAYLASVSA